MELFGIDLDEFASYLCKKCAASSTVRKDIAGTRETNYCVVQGKFIAQIEEALTKRYHVPQKYIEIEDKIPSSTKKAKK